MDACGFAALCYPGADAFHLQVCSDFINWIFIIDDWMEYGVVNVQEMHESCILALRDPTNFDTEHLGAKMSKTQTAGPGCTERFIRGSELFFAAVAKQVDDRTKGNKYDLESYIALRRHLVALKICDPLIEFVARINLPDEVVSHPVIKALEDAVNDHASWSNDIYLQDAINYAGQMCKDAIHRFDSNRVILSSWDEKVDKQVAIYVEGLQNFMVCSLHWHLDSARYGVRPDRIMKLLPKRPL
ncbi:terpenoid synthase [Suillus decipiens]|nr:terpenoid synthase [Suillus decipiens]